MKYQEEAEIVGNVPLQGRYFQLVLRAPAIAQDVQPGQFVHVRIPLLTHRVLRRPFSVCDADPNAGLLRIVYKVVGEGTAQLAKLSAGATANLIGPLGHGFTIPSRESFPVIVAGGYGCAAMYLLARRSPVACLCLFGARTATELILVQEFRNLGCEVRIVTDDGSAGGCGPVTSLLHPVLDQPAALPPRIYACGPHPMLRVLATTARQRGLDAEIALDHVMCCGVGACFACVVKCRSDKPEGWEYVRTCTEGPVFQASETVWD